MKDQRKLLNQCILNGIPACVFQGDDSCMVEILEAALEIYHRHGCTTEFQYDFRLLLNEVKAYQEENPQAVKLPKLSPSETESIREEMDETIKELEHICNEAIETWKRSAEEATYEVYSKEKLYNGKFGIVESGDHQKSYVMLSSVLYDQYTDASYGGWFYNFLGSCSSFYSETGIRHGNCKVISIEVVSDDIAQVRYSAFLHVKTLLEKAYEYTIRSNQQLKPSTLN